MFQKALIGALVSFFILFNLVVFEAFGQTRYAPNTPQSEEFRTLFALPNGKFVNQVRPLLEKLRNYHLVFVPGFNSSANTFSEQIGFFLSVGIQSTLVPIEPWGSVAWNGSVIVDMVMASAKPVVLISHSKGGLDALDGLTRLMESKHIKEKVHAWITLQSPFYGTFLADFLATQRVMGMFNDIYYLWYGKTTVAPTDMRSEVRFQWMKRNKEKVKEVLKIVPTLAVSTYKTTPSQSGWTLEARRLWMQKDLGFINDGVVGVMEGRLMGAEYVVIDEVDHTETCHRTRSRYDLIRMTETLLLMADSRINQKALQPPANVHVDPQPTSQPETSAFESVTTALAGLTQYL